MAEHAVILRRLVTELESRGSRIYFVELPYPGNLGQSKYAVTARSLAQQAFPDSRQWPVIDYHLSELRWIDAAHMDERSAIIVAQGIDGFLRGLKARKSPSQACVRHAPRTNCRLPRPAFARSASFGSASPS
jgi:hypothetical protein